MQEISSRIQLSLVTEGNAKHSSWSKSSFTGITHSYPFSQDPYAESDQLPYFPILNISRDYEGILICLLTDPQPS